MREIDMLEKKWDAAKSAAADAIEKSPHPDTQAMVAWIKKSCWATPGTEFRNAAECCFLDAYEGEYNGASPADAKRWMRRWKAAQEKFGVQKLEAKMDSARQRESADDAAIRAKFIAEKTGMDEKSLCLAGYAQVYDPFDSEIFLSVDFKSGQITGKCRCKNSGDAILTWDCEGKKWSVAYGPDYDYSGSKWESLH